MVLRLVVVGTRTFDNYKCVEMVCEGIIANTEKFLGSKVEVEVVSGGEGHVDDNAELYARLKRYNFTIFSPEWDREGKFAGYKRNSIMARYAIGDFELCDGPYSPRTNTIVVLVAFWDGRSRATRQMIDEAIAYQFDTVHIELHHAIKE